VFGGAAASVLEVSYGLVLATVMDDDQIVAAVRIVQDYIWTTSALSCPSVRTKRTSTLSTARGSSPGATVASRTTRAAK
jgi:hypothetical protein